MIVTFHGVRGSSPCQSPHVARYGGNTSCVSVMEPGELPVLFDMGTGVRYFGDTLGAGEAFVGTVLLSHLHWDHVQGLPFFRPLLRPGAEATIFAPAQESGRHPGEVLAEVIRPPMFPVPLAQLANLTIREAPAEFTVGSFSVRTAVVPHNGVMLGYRLDLGAASVVYVPDHQQPCDDDGNGLHAVDDAVVELCRGADLLIHDAQFTPPEFVTKSTWGHCTGEYAVSVAAAAGVRTLVLFHHDPYHDDADLDTITTATIEHGRAAGVDVVAAYEGLSIELSR